MAKPIATPLPSKQIIYSIIDDLVKNAPVDISAVLSRRPGLTADALSAVLSELTEFCLIKRLPILTSVVVDDVTVTEDEQEWLAGYIAKYPARTKLWITYCAIVSVRVNGPLDIQTAGNRLKQHIETLSA